MGENNEARRITDLAAYEVLSHEYLPDIDSDSWLLRHKKTGARIALLPKDDNNKVFYIAFRTPPEDSTGVAHIVEHTVLCGSRDFPVKDPFIELAKGSLNTFLNAMTYPDKTVYPVASCNMQDFKNLMHVYLDAVLYPNIYTEKNIFRQEGWHYEAESADAPVTVNGVVYNEMKGALSSPESILGRGINAALYPHTPYAHESGGDPVRIPDLSYEDYLDFHRRYYHPSNSYLYLYGDMDMAERLTWIDEHYLSRFDRLQIDSTISTEPAFTEQAESSLSYSILPEEDPKGKTFLSWNVAVLPDSLDAERTTAFKILDYVICDAEGAPVRRALREKGLGEDVYSMFEPGIRQPSYSIVSKYTDPEKKDEFVATVRQTLTVLARDGINPRAIEAGINYYEFRYREADFGSYSKGLIYGLNALDSWLYDDEKPFIGLRVGDSFDFLRKEAENGYFEKMIRECLLENPHCAVLVLTPEQGMSDRLDEEMRQRLEVFAKNCTPGEREAIVLDLQALRSWQKTPDPEENIRRIPMLRREDLTREAIPPLNELCELPLPVRSVQDLPAGSTARSGPVSGVPAPVPAQLTAITHPLSTNRIDYMTFIFDVRSLPEKYIRHLGIFKTLFSVLDTRSHDYASLGHEINISTGGIGCIVTTYNRYDGTSADDGQQSASKRTGAARDSAQRTETAPGKEKDRPYRLTLEVSVKALHKNLQAAFDLVREILMTTNYNMPERILEVLEEERAGMRAGMTASGHATAAQRAVSYISEPAAMMDIVTGIEAYRTLDRVCEEIREPEKAQELCSLLAEMAAAIFRADNLLFDCTACREDLPGILAAAQELAASLNPPAAEEQKLFVPVPEKKNEGLTTAGQVQFVCRAGSFAGHGRESTGAFRVLRVLLGYEYLWTRIRMEGGAYGCMSSFTRDGLAFLVSYRDPHLRRTIRTFEETAAFLRGFDVDERTLTKYIIGAVSALDQPMTPSVYGRFSLSSWLSGIGAAYLQKERDQVLDCTAEDIRALADYLDAVMDDGCLCVVGSDAKIRENSGLFGEIRKLV